jgi:carbon-monoxide dehydrogenase medium subunit
MTFAVHRPGSVAEAVALAGRLGDAARFIAGGTDLVVQINQKRCAPDHLIDITRLGELGGIEETQGGIRIGALTTHKEIERHPAFQGSLRGLVEAACVVGGHQVRNVGTIGGNIANASPAADVVVALLALGADVSLVGASGTRAIKLEEFLIGPGCTARREAELLTSVQIPKLSPIAASAFVKAGRRKAMEISVVCVGACLAIEASSRCTDARIALGAVGRTALRARGAEDALRGQRADESAFKQAGQIAAAHCHPISDVRASAQYRRLLVEALVARALTGCLARIAEQKS